MSMMDAITSVPSSVSMGFRPDLDGELAAILAQPVQSLAPLPWSAAVGSAKNPSLIARMFASEAFRHKRLDGLVQQPVAAVTEKLFHLRVDQQDGPSRLTMTIPVGAASTTRRNFASRPLAFGDVDDRTPSPECHLLSRLGSTRSQPGTRCHPVATRRGLVPLPWSVAAGR